MDYTIRTASQLEPILKAFRKSKGMSQIELSQKLGVSQQALSLLEASPHRASFERLLSVLASLDVEVILREKGSLENQAQSLW